ncbi:hypothetical protein A5657_03020 [Mycobacterium kubicae]|nr:hypothetical protein A5657_03020 [Mycobacterium kubicae]
MIRQCSCEVSATFEAVYGSLGEPDGEDWVKLAKLGSCVGKCGRLEVEMAADYHGRVGVREELRAGQEVVGGGRQRVLVGPAIKIVAQ